MHTWTGLLQYHPHSHLLVSGGGVTGDGQFWREPPGQFLLPVKALSKLIAGQDSVTRLQKAKPNGLRPSTTKDRGSGSGAHSASTTAGASRAVVEYLARYAFRIAITNSTDRRHGRHPRDLQVQAARHRRLGNVPTDGRRVPPPIPDARPAEGFS